MWLAALAWICASARHAVVSGSEAEGSCRLCGRDLLSLLGVRSHPLLIEYGQEADEPVALVLGVDSPQRAVGVDFSEWDWEWAGKPHRASVV
jgi:hypothetical protein